MKSSRFVMIAAFFALVGCFDDKPEDQNGENGGDTTATTQTPTPDGNQQAEAPPKRTGCETRAAVLKVEWPNGYSGSLYWNDELVWAFPTPKEKQSELAAYSGEERLAQGLVWYKAGSFNREEVALILKTEDFEELNEVRASYEKVTEGEPRNKKLKLRVGGSCVDDVSKGYTLNTYVTQDYDIVEDQGTESFEAPKDKIPAQFLQ